MTTTSAPAFARFVLPENGTVVCRILHCDVVGDRDSGVPMGRFKVELHPAKEQRQFLERWDLIAPALAANGVAHPDHLPAIPSQLARNPRSYVEVPIAITDVAVTVRTLGIGIPSGRQIAIVPRTLRAEKTADDTTADSSAGEFADAVDVGVAAVKPVFEKHGIELTGRDAIDVGRAVLEQRRRGT